MVIYFPRTFSTSYNMINSVRKYFSQKGVDIKFVVSHPDKNSLTLMAADNALIEPSYEANNNFDFYIDICKKYRVDLIIPGESSLVFFKTNESVFENIGVKLLISCRLELLNILRSKTLTYEFFKKNNINILIPKYRLVKSLDDFVKACKYVSVDGSLPCFKPDVSQGASGFRIVDNNIKSQHLISGFPNHKGTIDYYIDQLGKIEKFPNLIVTEYLEQEEVTLDTLSYNNQCLFYFPRIKDLYNRTVTDRSLFNPLLSEFISKSGIKYLFNLQIRYHNNIPYLLEVNPRYSGGSYLAEENGYPMLSAAIDLIMFNSYSNFRALEPMSFKIIESYIKI